MKYNTEEIGNIIKLEREKNNMTQKQLSDELHVTNKQISNYEHGKLTPPIDILLNLCRIFDCELGYLLGENDYSKGTKLQTAICDKTGLSINSIEAITELSKDRWRGDNYITVLNRLLSSDVFPKFIDELSEVDSTTSDFNDIMPKLENKLGKEMFKHTLEAYYDPHIDYEHDTEFQNNNPKLCNAMFELDQSLTKKHDLECAMDISRYHLNKTMEALIDNMYPESK